MATLLKIIQNQGKISLISLIMNPHSFTQSVENLFDLSFLIADGHVGIERTQDMIYIRIPHSQHHRVNAISFVYLSLSVVA